MQNHRNLDNNDNRYFYCHHQHHNINETYSKDESKIDDSHRSLLRHEANQLGTVRGESNRNFIAFEETPAPHYEQEDRKLPSLEELVSYI